MFGFLLRKTTLRKLNKEDQDIALMLKDEIRLSVIAFCGMLVILIMPCVLLLKMCFVLEETIANAVGVIVTFFAYYGFIIWILSKFTSEIATFLSLIKGNLFFSRYTVKGNAILKEEFEKIKKEDDSLYYDLTHQTCRGYCYHTCFSILKCLQKGEIKFIAEKAFDFERETEHYYTMHVLYVNGDWCFDTYSNKQHKTEELMAYIKAVECRTFNYEEIKDFKYDEFRKKYSPEIKKWCDENDCYEEWSKF